MDAQLVLDGDDLIAVALARLVGAVREELGHQEE
jgi:hypothetical protein